MHEPPVHISILIPVLNEASTIGSLIHKVASALPGHEIIVIDGGSADATADIAATYTRVLRTTASRGSSLNEAGWIARGNVLLFLHADTALPRDAAAEIVRLLRNPRVVGGAFRFAFDESCAMARAIAAWVNFRSRVFNVFLGDQALFVRKDVFLRAGGFRDWSLMEDLEILHRLRRFGSVKMTRASIITSARRHMRDGWVRTTATVWLMSWLYVLGVSPRRLKDLYCRRPSRRR